MALFELQIVILHTQHTFGLKSVTQLSFELQIVILNTQH
jgi:hypothetical protein